MTLQRHCECAEEGTRNVVAECLGKLTLIDPTTLLPRLEELLNTPSGRIRTTVITAIKFTISDQVTFFQIISFFIHDMIVSLKKKFYFLATSNWYYVET